MPGRVFVVLLLALSVCGGARAGELWPPEQVERLVEELAEEGGTESAEQLLEELSVLWLRPRNLRGEPLARLRELPLIAPGEAERIVSFLQENPEARAVQAVCIALGMPRARRELFAMFYTIDGAAPRLDSTLGRRLRGDVVQRLAYNVPLFCADSARMAQVYGSAEGTPLALMTRAVASTPDGIAFGIKGVKRPGEPFFHSFSPQGYPYYSAYVQLQGRRPSSPRVVVGDYAAEFGTGQTVGSGPALFRAQSPYAWGTMGAGVRGRLGSCDNSSLRGAAVQHQPLPWLLYSVAISAQPLTASLADGKKSPELQGRISSILSLPTYTKQREQDRHFNTWEFGAIAHAQATFGPVSIGYTAMAMRYSRDFVPPDAASFRPPPPARTHMRNGLSLHAYLGGWRVWGEATLASPLRGATPGHAVSANVGVVYSPGYAWSIGAQGYYYPYNASRRYARGVVAAPQNRAGGILNAMVRISETTSLLLGGEYALYPNPKVMRSAPTSSWRGSAEVQYASAQGSTFDARYRYREYQAVRSMKTLESAELARIHEARARGDFRLGAWLSLRASLLYAYRDGEGSAEGRHNWGVAQDARLSVCNGSLTLTCRGAFYDCRGKGVMLALYEYAPLYSMAMSRCSQKGWRVYGMLDWRFYRGFAVTVKAACTQLMGDSVAKLTELERQRRSMLELTAQARWQF